MNNIVAFPSLPPLPSHPGGCGSVDAAGSGWSVCRLWHLQEWQSREACSGHGPGCHPLQRPSHTGSSQHRTRRSNGTYNDSHNTHPSLTWVSCTVDGCPIGHAVLVCGWLPYRARSISVLVCYRILYLVDGCPIGHGLYPSVRMLSYRTRSISVLYRSV